MFYRFYIGLLSFLLLCSTGQAAQFDLSLLETIDASTMQKYLHEGLNPNQPLPDGSTLMLVAAARSSAPVLQTLLSAGGSPNATDRRGNSALINAAQFNPDVEVSRLLLEADAPVDGINFEGGTALLYAANQNPNPTVIKTLLEAGANPEHADSQEIFPLIAAATTALPAASRDTAQVIKYLLNSGANPHRYYKGYRPLDYVKANPHLQNSAAVQLLEEAMWNWQD